MQFQGIANLMFDFMFAEGERLQGESWIFTSLANSVFLEIHCYSLEVCLWGSIPTRTNRVTEKPVQIAVLLHSAIAPHIFPSLGLMKTSLFLSPSVNLCTQIDTGYPSLNPNHFISYYHLAKCFKGLIRAGYVSQVHRQFQCNKK